jgi:UDP-N-acetylmuramate dehydrogenase
MILEKNFSISHLSNYKTPATARYFYEVTNQNVENENFRSLQEVFQYIKDNNLKHLIIWWGTNLLFAFDVFDGIIIKNSLTWWSYDKQTMILESYANEPIRKIAESLEKDHVQPLWHRFIGLPGSIGGAIFGNAGCFGLETEGNFVEAKVLNKQTW